MLKVTFSSLDECAEDGADLVAEILTDTQYNDKKTIRDLLNQQIEQMRSFTWQLSNHSGVEMYLHLKEQTPKNILTKKEPITNFYVNVVNLLRRS